MASVFSFSISFQITESWCSLIAILNYRLDYIWETNLLDTPGRNFLNLIIWIGKTYPYSEPYLTVAAHIKG